MGRKKIEIKYIKNHRQRKITYHKRRKGLIKKIQQLAMLCGIEARLEIYDAHGIKSSFQAGKVASKKETDSNPMISEEELENEPNGTGPKPSPKLEEQMLEGPFQPNKCQQSEGCDQSSLGEEQKQKNQSPQFMKLDPVIMACPNFPQYFYPMTPTYLPPIFVSYQI